ncbi:MAG: hypothetical protein WC479_10715 [Candidatus Izemoplasmatales bacterium]|jgi:hypothetical protein
MSDMILRKPEDLVGTHTDLVLEWYGRPYRITVLGRDDNGMVVRWHYKNFRLRIAKIVGEEPINNKKVDVYAVTEVFMKNKESKDGK